MWYTYDNLRGVTKRSKKNLSGVLLSEETFAYDDAGNLIGDHSENLFEYCTGNRLSAYNGQPISYDRDGNMISAEWEARDVTLTYDSANRLTSADGQSYTYDVRGVRVRNLCNDIESK